MKTNQKPILKNETSQLKNNRDQKILEIKGKIIKLARNSYIQNLMKSKFKTDELKKKLQEECRKKIEKTIEPSLNLGRQVDDQLKNIFDWKKFETLFTVIKSKNLNQDQKIKVKENDSLKMKLEKEKDKQISSLKKFLFQILESPIVDNPNANIISQIKSKSQIKKRTKLRIVNSSKRRSEFNSQNKKDHKKIVTQKPELKINLINNKSKNKFPLIFSERDPFNILFRERLNFLKCRNFLKIYLYMVQSYSSTIQHTHDKMDFKGKIKDLIRLKIINTYFKKLENILLNKNKMHIRDENLIGLQNNYFKKRSINKFFKFVNWETLKMGQIMQKIDFEFLEQNAVNWEYKKLKTKAQFLKNSRYQIRNQLRYSQKSLEFCLSRSKKRRNLSIKELSQSKIFFL